VSVRVWAHPDDDSLLIQFDDYTIYEIPDGFTSLSEQKDQTVGEPWVELVPENTTPTPPWTGRWPLPGQR